MSRPVVKLVIGTTELEDDLLSYEIESDILTPADAFSMVAFNRDGGWASKLALFDAVKVTVDENVVLDGFIDELNYTVGADGPRVEITGRDKFGYLVDCSAFPKTFKNVTLSTLAMDLARTWVAVWTAGNGGDALPIHNAVKVEPGESVMDVLLRIAKQDRVWVWLDPAGVGVIGRPDYTTTPTHAIYQLGPNSGSPINNALSSSVRLSGHDRYSEIHMTGSKGNTKAHFGKSCLIERGATDSTVPVTRPLIHTDGDCKSLKQAQEMAQDEVASRAFHGTTLKYTVPGFYGSPPGGGAKQLFAPDQRMSVTDEFAGADGIFYCSSRRFVCDERGHRTDLELHVEGWLEA